MSSNKILKWLNSNLLKIWVLHIIIFYPICGFLAENLQKGKLNFKENLDPNSLTIALRYPVSIVFGAWDAFPFFIFMAFTISFLLKFVLKERFFINYVVSLITSYLIVYIIIIVVNYYNSLPYYFIIPSLIITFSIQMIIFRKSLFTKSAIQNKI